MPISFRCSQCNQLLRVPDTAAGKSARCPKCQALMNVPAASEPQDQPSGSTEAFPPARRPQTEAASFSSPETAEITAFTPPPNPAAPENPFADAGGNPFGRPSDSPLGGGPESNPYASPTGSAYAFEPKPEGHFRTGLPWEQGQPGLKTWWETAKLCMMQPSYAYSIMRRDGGIGQPMGYCALGLTMGVLGQMVWYLPFIIAAPLLGAPPGGNGGEMAAMIGAQLGWQVFVGVMTVVLGATIGLLIGAAIAHVCLLLVGGANYDFETTLRVLGYANGATSWLNVIPCVGGLVAAIWLLVLEIIGLARAHETSVGKALLAVFLPILVCMAAFIALIVFGVGFAAMQ